MAEHWEYAASDADGWTPMPARWAETLAAALPEVTVWRRVVHVHQPTGGGELVVHGDWHQVEVTR